MPQPVVHFEIIGRRPKALREYYGELFDWSFDLASPVAPDVSDAGEYGFLQRLATPDGGGIPGGVGGGSDHEPHAIFYVGVDDVARALERAVQLGGTKQLGPVRNPNGKLVVAHFTDPEGNLVGLAGPR